MGGDGVVGDDSGDCAQRFQKDGERFGPAARQPPPPPPTPANASTSVQATSRARRTLYRRSKARTPHGVRQRPGHGSSPDGRRGRKVGRLALSVHRGRSPQVLQQRSPRFGRSVEGKPGRAPRKKGGGTGAAIPSELIGGDLERFGSRWRLRDPYITDIVSDEDDEDGDLQD